jgi:isoquinoline 1-oxidoreductase subunit beta
MKHPSGMRWKTTRRGFLIGAGVGGLGVVLYYGLKAAIPCIVDKYLKSGHPCIPTQPFLWFGVDPKSGVTLYIPKGEMGQGVQSMMAQLVAEELELAPLQLKIEIANSDQRFGEVYTTNESKSTATLYYPLRQAAATLREMLRIEAAKQLGVPVTKVFARQGACVVGANPQQKLEYREIVAAKTGKWVEPKSVPLKSPEHFTQIGSKTFPRVDVPGKVSGKAQYGIQARVPKITFGAVARPPQFGAILRSGKAGEAATMPGVKKVVIDIEHNFAGVVADTRTRAWNAVAKLELEYTQGSTISQAELDRLVTAKAREGTILRQQGNVDAYLKNPLEASYRTPLAAHAHLEPLTALVDFRKDAIEAWVSTQDINLEVKELQQAFGTRRKVLVHGMQMGGSFGRKGIQTAIVEAARLSQAAKMPVQVTWTREEEMRHSFYRQPSHAVLRGTVNRSGRITALEHTVASGDILTGEYLPILVEPIFAALYQFDPGIIIGLFSLYDIPHYRVYTRLVDLPIPTGFWRGLGGLPHGFALESFIDELAHRAKHDPIEFRLQNLPNTPTGKRLKTVLEKVREDSKWGKAPSGSAQGVACGFANNTAVAIVVEVRVEAAQIQVTKVDVAVDPGLVVSPTGAELQAIGSVVMGLSSTLIEQIRIENGAVIQKNFDDYPILRLAQTPRNIEVKFYKNAYSPKEPQGMGEPVIGPVAAAVANAVFTLTGQRLRELPLKLKK